MRSASVRLESPPALPTRLGADPDVVLAATVMFWITVVLMIDSSARLTVQHVLGVATAAVLLAFLSREASLVRVQTAVVVVFATAVEYTFSPLLEVYLYRFDNVPLYVPPGHGLVYLAALALGRSATMRACARPAIAVTVVVGGAWAVWGLTLSPTRDVLGAFWFLCLLGFLRWGRSRLLYVGAFVVVSYLEILGTSLQTWVWQPLDPTGLVPIGNPPSCAAGGYGWFDLAAVLLAPRLLAQWGRLPGVTRRVGNAGKRAPAPGPQR